MVACAQVRAAPNQRSRNSENLSPASQPESEPNEAPHCARAVIAAHFGLIAIPGENAIGVRVREKGVFSAECSGGQHRGVSPSAGPAEAMQPREPRKSGRGQWADLNIDLSAEVIDEARRETWKDFRQG
jgi:hypothetical protein